MTSRPYTHPRIEPGATGHLHLVEPLKALPRELEALVGDLADHFMRERPEGGWSIKEIVGHLRDAAEVYHKRLYMLATQFDPALEPYDQEAWVRERNYQDADVQELLADIERWRAETVRLLTTLVHWNWARTGQHPDHGRMSIRQMVEWMIEHERAHLEDIRRRVERR